MYSDLKMQSESAKALQKGLNALAHLCQQLTNVTGGVAVFHEVEIGHDLQDPLLTGDTWSGAVPAPQRQRAGGQRYVRTALAAILGGGGGLAKEVKIKCKTWHDIVWRLDILDANLILRKDNVRVWETKKCKQFNFF